ncbi:MULTISPECIES: HAD family phosphatase [unclassified Achromobacter]|uniref:HAD family hydrolase n=1 Tax=unclassified Achromobacter TaxID=2626865 RepID=UPI0008B192A5|nr:MULTISPECIES: HAD family hydrolase [unclassified Achromobacter]SEI47210.1 Phosphoserine phosphatase [Achromobacter sp. NFACC18-2]SIT30814.1 Phosphoserine phosphatase [Achromobacter sp. MFA1 R4]
MRRFNELEPVRRWLAMMWLLALCLLAGCAAPQSHTHADLPSWADGPSRDAIVEFVKAVTQPGSPDFVAPEARIAVFDNDGTLWSEQPLYFEVLFALDEVRAQAPSHPEWQVRQPFKAALQNDQAALAKSGSHGMMEIIVATHTGMSVDQFSQRVDRWRQTAHHPQTGMLYSSMTYLPMRELLDYLRARDFKTYIVSGGETEFMRPWTQAAYGIPPEQVIGTVLATDFVSDGATFQLMRQPKLEFNDDGPGKPVAIQRQIGRRPILAFGNSDGDLQMLQWTMAGPGKRFAGLVHHTDAKREWAYDRQSHVGRLDKALDAARVQGWTIVDMEKEWKRIYPSEKP